MTIMRHCLFAAAAATLALGFTATAAECSRHLHTAINDVPRRQNDAKEGCQRPIGYGAQSELRRRKCLPGIALEQRARRHQKPRAVDVRSGRPRSLRRQSLGCLWHSRAAYRLCRGLNQQGFGPVCRWQELDGCWTLLRPVHAAQRPAHHYTFVLIATDFEPKELPPGLTRDEVIAKFGPPPAHVKGDAGLVGLFVNPWHE